jgi:hypothetical protein
MTASQRDSTPVLPTAITQHDTIYWIFRGVAVVLNGLFICAAIALGGFDTWLTPAALLASLASIFVLVASVYAPMKTTWLNETVRGVPLAQYGFTGPDGAEILPERLYAGPYDDDQITRWQNIRPFLIACSFILMAIGVGVLGSYIGMFS